MSLPGYWNDHAVEPPRDPVPPSYVVDWRWGDNGAWNLQMDADGTPAVFADEDEAERYADQLRAELTDDGEPTPYRYQVRKVIW